MITILIDGEPVAQGRPRFTKQGHAYDPAKSREYKERVALAAKEAMRGKEPYPKGVALRCILRVFCKTPKSFTKLQRRMIEDKMLLPTKKPDIDNIAKAITDAMNGIVYADDAQIAVLSCRKHYGDNPGAIVTVEPIFEGLGKK